MMSDVQDQSAAENVRRLARVLTLSKQMLVHGGVGEWETVTELERARRDDLTLCFSEAAFVVDDETIAEAFATLFHINEELMAKVKSARDAVIEQGREITRSRGAVDCYRKFDTKL